MAKALIGPTGYGTFGIVWRESEYAKGYSGPFLTQQEAEARARDIAEYNGEPLTIETVDNVNRV